MQNHDNMQNHCSSLSTVTAIAGVYNDSMIFAYNSDVPSILAVTKVIQPGSQLPDQEVPL